MHFEYTVTSKDFSIAGEASSKIKQTLKRLNIDSGIIRRVAIAAYEAELNIAIHSLGGRMLLYIEKDMIRIVAEDQGPGIGDIGLAMKEGYTTAGHEVQAMGFGAGMGLPNIKKCSDNLQIQSAAGKPTTLTIEFNLGGNHGS